ncbi:hypothetical protein [Tsukamurella spumae]|uniref:Uncharacterized protein n=1 Tax=Tsukamurella spumae TaxID=44753 RepID=A0A846XAD9_9ACTN|nr:hypothetical protein [Tsukamurella spumae]NKY20630.1 hypothetical protein [Tsukamurella spumae]
MRIRTLVRAGLVATAACALSVAAPSSAAPWDVVLGQANLYPSSSGYGTVAPRTVDNSSICAGIVHSITWTGWGAPVAVGRGTQCHSAGAVGRGERPRIVTLSASNLGLCNGRLAYRTLRYDGGEARNICPR